MEQQLDRIHYIFVGDFGQTYSYKEGYLNSQREQVHRCGAASRHANIDEEYL